MPRAVKSPAVARLEEKQSKMKKILRSLGKQLKKQRQDEKNSREKARRDAHAAKEKLEEQTAFKHLIMLETTPIEQTPECTFMDGTTKPPKATPAEREGFKASAAKKSLKTLKATPNEMENQMSNDPGAASASNALMAIADKEMEATVDAITKCDEKELQDVLNDADAIMTEAEVLFTPSKKSGQGVVSDSASSGKDDCLLRINGGVEGGNGSSTAIKDKEEEETDSDSNSDDETSKSQ